MDESNYVKNAGSGLVLKGSFPLKIYSLPISNVVVERVFSRVTPVKTKLRNKMEIELLTSILRIKAHVEINVGCCLFFQPTAAMVDFNSSSYNCYETKEAEDTANAFVSLSLEYVVHCWRCFWDLCT